MRIKALPYRFNIQLLRGLHRIDASKLASASPEKQKELIHGYFEEIARTLGFVLGATPTLSEREVKATAATASSDLGLRTMGTFGDGSTRATEPKGNEGAASSQNNPPEAAGSSPPSPAKKSNPS